jgi:hypothetical protein
MRNLKVTRVKDSSVGFLASGKRKEIKRTYLKKLSEYLTATLPESVKTYTAATKKLIKAQGDPGTPSYKTGGQVAIETDLVNEVLIRVIYGETPEKFKERVDVIVVARKFYPVNFFRRMNRSSNVLQYVLGLKSQFQIKEMMKDPKLLAEVEEVEKYFAYLKNCLTTGVIPLLDAKTK